MDKRKSQYKYFKDLVNPYNCFVKTAIVQLKQPMAK